MKIYLRVRSRLWRSRVELEKWGGGPIRSREMLACELFSGVELNNEFVEKIIGTSLTLPATAYNLEEMGKRKFIKTLSRFIPHNILNAYPNIETRNSRNYQF
jgi:hypothetical protein